MTTVSTTPRKRDAEATRRAIIDAAETCFGRAGYDQVTLREIAALAGIDVALVGRYFGSKEELFAEWIARSPRPKTEYPSDRSTFGAWMARRILSKDRDIPRMLALHHSVTNPGAAAIIRQMILERSIGPLGAWIGGPDGELRASLIVAHLIGLSVLRDILKIGTLADAERETLITQLGRALQAYIDD